MQAFPAYRDCLPFRPTSDGCDTSQRAPAPAAVAATVAAYNAAIATAAAVTGSHVVDLYGTAERLVQAGTFDSIIGADNFHPNAAGYRLVAGLFARAYAALGARASS